ncbi:MAG TPA: hypothetical protein VN665_02185 [Candidatus Paceibacterota bacterium]|nr:hypothetical protein [Candidatus Paceibacterota bacterium]
MKSVSSIFNAARFNLRVERARLDLGSDALRKQVAELAIAAFVIICFAVAGWIAGGHPPMP